ncbi:hypothetical protein ACLB2K_030621 [Fragaria x ananassa]
MAGLRWPWILDLDGSKVPDTARWSYPSKISEFMGTAAVAAVGYSPAGAYHSVIGMTPFQALYGYEPPLVRTYVEQKIGQVAYKLKLPDSAKVHLVFHVFLLKKIGDKTVTVAHLPPNLDPNNPRWYPAGSIVEEATWEEADDIMQRFPDFKT